MRLGWKTVIVTELFMPGARPFRVVDVGAGSIKLADFVATSSGSLRLTGCSTRPVQSSAGAAAAEHPWLTTLAEALAEGASATPELSFCAPAAETFFRLFNVPAVPSTPFGKLVEFEARQQVPIPLTEMVWDYQPAIGPRQKDSEVIFAAMRRSIAETLCSTAETHRLRTVLIEASAAAEINALRFNYGDLDGCSLLLDIGAKSTQVVLSEPERFFARTINLGSAAITREFTQQARLALDEAERLLVQHGFVGPEDGGGTDDPRLNLLGKATRQVLSRLCIMVHQTMQFYRTHHGGAAPSRLFIAGGLARMPHLAEFLAGKFHPPGGVEVFNPLRSLEIDPALDVAQVAALSHSLGPVVGTALRRISRCPLELDLLPPAVRQKQAFRRKLPWALSAAAALALAMLSFAKAAQVQSHHHQAELDTLVTHLNHLKADRTQFTAAVSAQQAATRQLDQYLEWIADRRYWAELTTSVNAQLGSVQSKLRTELSPKTEIWVDRWQPMLPPELTAGPLGAAKSASGLEISQLKLVFRARDLTSVRPEANALLSFALKDAFAADSKRFTLASISNRISDERDQTFKVEMTLQLKRPMKL